MLKEVKKLANEPIIVVTYEAPFDPRGDIGAAQAQISEILNHTISMINLHLKYRLIGTNMDNFDSVKKL